MTESRTMHPDRSPPRFTCLGEGLDGAPRCPGVYRLYSAHNALLYIGKSVDIATRLGSHFSDGRQRGRQQRMMSAVARVDCELTAGDLGAQLVENAAIKAEAPLYNRRQRRNRTLWTQRLHQDDGGFLRVVPSDFCTAGERREAVYGLFRSRTQMHDGLRRMARDEGLCLRRLGAEKGRGPCFQAQVGRCRGACCGRETATEHNRRLLEALERQRIAAWPFPGPILLHEVRARRCHERQPTRQYHVLDHWTYLGSFTRRDRARICAAAEHALFFDRDAYHIALRALRGGDCEVLDAAEQKVLSNPFLAAGQTDPTTRRRTRRGARDGRDRSNARKSAGPAPQAGRLLL